MLLMKNGKLSSGKRTKHIDIRYLCEGSFRLRGHQEFPLCNR
jgi:hypothetical protein